MWRVHIGNVCIIMFYIWRHLHQTQNIEFDSQYRFTIHIAQIAMNYNVGSCDAYMPIVNEFPQYSITRCSDRVDRALPSHVEGREFESKPSQTNDLNHWYVSLCSLALYIKWTRQRLLSTESRYCHSVGYCDIGLVSQWGSTHYNVTINVNYLRPHPDMILDVARN